MSTTRATKTASTLEPLFAVALIAAGGRPIITDVCDRRRARNAARNYNHDFPNSRFRACVRPVALQFAN